MKLSLKRLIAFLIDAIIILTVAVVAELLFLLYIFFFTNVAADSITYDIYYISPLSHLTLITIIFGIIHSSVFQGRSAGSTLANIVVVSHKKPLLSLISCICRSFLIFLIPYIYYVIVIPYLQKNILGKGITEVSLPTLEIFILLFLVLVVPLSIMWSGGSQSIYDRLLQLRVIHFEKDKQYHKIAPWRFTSAILSTAIISIFLAILLQESNDLRLKVAEMHPIFAKNTKKLRVLTHKMLNQVDETWIDQETVFWKPAIELLMKPSIMKDVRKLGLGNIRFLSDLELKDSVIIPKNFIVKHIYVNVNGRGIRKSKEFIFAFRDVIEQVKLPYKYLEISVHRDAAFGMFDISLTRHCYFQKGVGEPLRCPGELKGGIWFKHWRK